MLKTTLQLRLNRLLVERLVRRGIADNCDSAFLVRRPDLADRLAARLSVRVHLPLTNDAPRLTDLAHPQRPHELEVQRAPLKKASTEPLCHELRQERNREHPDSDDARETHRLCLFDVEVPVAEAIARFRSSEALA